MWLVAEHLSKFLKNGGMPLGRSVSVVNLRHRSSFSGFSVFFRLPKLEKKTEKSFKKLRKNFKRIDLKTYINIQ